ncbi:hypothetical protein Dform_00952 [Dehalogenimonas formicexedens]|uniref:Uncharacterized protein n=1 Tax=Dehalogenimonas formicexedens TaxID=1839801 RepID=A0A1P8F761_9CHLR|nr:hypothetical protein [Dehalogenimonas formicexedens]APV44293.1 hypothetical protein Dform_00952 [Dehalogenimonas formicexedens]
MTGRPANKLMGSLGGVALIFISLFSLLPKEVNAQTSDGSYQMYGFNLVGSLPMMNKNGQSISSGDLQTPDGKMSLKIPLGTIIHNAAGKNQEFISAILVQNPASVPSQQQSVIAYEIGTPGATFNPTVGLAFNYSDAELPSNISESSLYIAQWNGSLWVRLASDVNTSFNTVSTTISSFTTYALIGGGSTVTTTPSATTTPPATTTTNPTTSPSTQASTSETSSSGGSSSSTMIFVIGGAAVLLIILLIAVTRKS